MTESQAEYWQRRANEHARMAQASPHRAAVAAHTALARAYRERADDLKQAS